LSCSSARFFRSRHSDDADHHSRKHEQDHTVIGKRTDVNPLGRRRWERRSTGGRFARVEPRRRARAFVLGLLAGLPRVNCWTIAEHAGEAC
jgi:hypothetical protein